MHELRIMSSTEGDEVIQWDPEDKESVENARTKFTEKIKKGMIAYAEKFVEKKETVQIKEFDPALKKITMRPALSGG